ncbi:cytosolic endo-beta-N-acetylglucosaminidase 1-like isoform X1 [Salvia hispanica]|uniref:cytosolic endo-beta-N-acetylglucosaminidase 1-like isoform X1 n=2 Tax=Salvia hispanica TaxID=49212 RepID=UPI0020095E00|nr:cytosolic endo-beta-N-acetylglucosaminidase 1-like isoform X1 [Salvia hispanica]
MIPYLKSNHPKAYAALKDLRSFLSSLAMADDSSSSADPPPPFDPLIPATPLSYPLQTLEELESRAYFSSFHFPFNKASVKLPAAAALPSRPRTLVCHDMAGGYTDDRLVQGGANADAFAIWHWYLIDVFVYFSHNLVTLPPPCWTNTAHRHGVKVLGTFIMEWDEGKIRADNLLASKDSVRMYADRLTELAVALGFDGWLINMEVNLDLGQIPNLKEFISYLSQTMHSSLPGSLVIWYDSVTVDGDLNWQNQLNDKNKPFFDLCDGIFVNYSWEEDFPKQSAEVAADRNFDVYMGIDVFGRGTYGGGQWTTNVALDVIKKADVSAAIFAPGWVYETKQPPDFQTAQNRWWGLVEKSWGIVQNYPKVLPFYSNFNQGHGYHIYADGKQISSNQWNDLSSQSFQPFLAYSGDSKTEPIQVSIDFKGASYSGGGSITFVGTLDDKAEFRARLFHGELPLRNSPVHFTYSVKSNGNSLLGLALGFSSASNEKKTVLLAASGNTLLTMTQFSSRFTSVVMPRRVTKLDQEPGWIIQESSINMAGHILTEIQALCYRPKPERSAADYVLSRAPSEYYAVLGDLKISADGENTNFPPSDSWNVSSEFVSWTSGSQGSKNLSVKIIWQLKAGYADLFLNYNIFVEKLNSPSSGTQSRLSEVAHEYLGEAAVKSFYISDLEVPSGTSFLKFIIQVRGLDGTSQKLEDAPFLQLKVEG